MPTYVALINWTEQGISNYKDSVERYESAREAMSKLGVSFKDTYWTIGPYDIVSIIDAPDDQSLTAALLMIGAQGNIRTTTLRGFSADEMRGVIEKTQ